MKKLMLGLVMLALGQAGCEFIGGALVGAGTTGAGYEYNAYRQMQQLEDDYKNEKISRAEYETRKQQIEAGSIITRRVRYSFISFVDRLFEPTTNHERMTLKQKEEFMLRDLKG